MHPLVTEAAVAYRTWNMPASPVCSLHATDRGVDPTLLSLSNLSLDMFTWFVSISSIYNSLLLS